MWCLYVCEEVFSSFPALQELEMPVNALRGLTVDNSHFLQLQVMVTCIHFLLPSSHHMNDTAVVIMYQLLNKLYMDVFKKSLSAYFCKLLLLEFES